MTALALSSHGVAQIMASRCWERHCITVLATDGGRVLVKGQRPARGPLRFALLRAIARLVGAPLLQPVPARGGAAAQATEVRRLQALAAAGVPVPAVLHVATDHFAMQWIDGQPLQDRLRAEAPQALAAFEQGLLALRAVHRAGQCLSQAFSRNMICADGQVWMIDFEDDPLEVLPLDQAQARDWLAYLFSAVWVLNAPRREALRRWQPVAASLPARVQQTLWMVAGRLGLLRHLPRQRKPWGRDVVNLQAVAEFLHMWRISAESKPQE